MTANIMKVIIPDNSVRGRQRIEYQLEFQGKFSINFPTLEALNKQFESETGIAVMFPIPNEKTVIKYVSVKETTRKFMKYLSII